MRRLTGDSRPSESHVFTSRGCDQPIGNEPVADAFAGLTEQEQSILILRCILKMPDGKISEIMELSRYVVQRVDEYMKHLFFITYKPECIFYCMPLTGRRMKMISQLQFREMRSVDITQVDRSTLADIRNIHIDPTLPITQKMQNYLEQIGNPYCFLYGDTPVKIRFVSEGKTLKQSLCDYFLSLK